MKNFRHLIDSVVVEYLFLQCLSNCILISSMRIRWNCEIYDLWILVMQSYVLTYCVERKLKFFGELAFGSFVSVCRVKSLWIFHSLLGIFWLKLLLSDYELWVTKYIYAFFINFPKMTSFAICNAGIMNMINPYVESVMWLSNLSSFGLHIKHLASITR